MDVEGDSDATASEQLASGNRVGRYLLLERLGSGGVGWVFLAYDPELDRKVAVKVLRPDQKVGQLRGARLLREAQAMARLAHPNVVAVHDVGLWNEQVFVTMEYVRGATLATWLQQPRSLTEIVAVFLDAGRGLAAAHAAGLIHRDFKPDNVLVGEDGRARVMDFGLVRAHGDDAPDQDLDLSDGDVEAPERPSTSPLTSPLTRMGVVLGTPPYMAPEQFTGGPVDARTDQFAFCIALYEAIYGQRPFGLENLEHDVRRDIRQPRPAGKRAPQWLDDIVERGLAHDPAGRWPSMDVLLAALAVDPSVGRRRRIAVASLLVLAGVLAAGSWGFREHRHKQLAATCQAERHAVEEIWNSERAAALELRFTQTANPAAASSWTATQMWLDTYAEHLGRLREHNCMAHLVEQTRDDEHAALVVACLDDNQANFEALVEVLAESHEGLIQHAASAAAALPLLASCTDAPRQTVAAQPPADVREGLQRQLYRGEALRTIGEIDEARELANSVLDRAEALDWKPAVARAQLILAHLQAEATELREAQRLAELAFRKAAVVGDTLLMLDAALLVAHLANGLGEYADAEAWIETSAELIADGGLESSTMAARLAWTRSGLLRARGRLADARAEAERSLQLYESILGPDHPTLTNALEALTTVLQDLDEKQLAKATIEREFEILARAYGPDNIRLINAYNTYGASLQVNGDPEGARDYYMRGIAITERVFGPDNLQLMAPLLNIGLLAYDAGDLEAARGYFERSIAINTAAGGENAPHAIKLLVNLGNTLSRQGHHEQALAQFDRCVDLLEAAQQEQFDLRETFVRASHADAHVRAGNLDAAYPLYERVVTVVLELAGPNDPKLVRPLLGLAGIDIERGELDAAEAKLERAAALIEKEPDRRWALEFRQGQLLWARGERERAVTQLRALRERQAGPASTWPLAVGEIDAWLHNHAAH